MPGETTWEEPNGFKSGGNTDVDYDDNEDDDASNEPDNDDDDAYKSDASTDFNKINADTKDWDDDADSDEKSDADNFEESSTVLPSSPADANGTLEHKNEMSPHSAHGDADAAAKNSTALLLAGKWSKHLDEEGREYYNESTQETQWDKPDGFIEAAKWSRH